MKHSVKDAINFSLKGMAMGAANVIPGVSGGTIALITGIFERLINAIKSFNLQALKLVLKGDFKGFARHVDFFFLAFVLFGIALAILTIAKLFDYLFEHYPIHIWAFFFGLVMASVYFVARRIEKWNWAVVLNFIIGTAAAISISLLTPAAGNSAVWYVMICGMVAACSMILPGLSGSFVLILMGNYQLIMIDAVNNMRMDILIPTVLGAGIGILAFSWILSWVFKKYRNQTIALLSGFIMGSLGILWPWKNVISETFNGEIKAVGYEWYLPQINAEFAVAVVIIIAGFVSIWAMEYAASEKEAA
ncbi:MAG: DUF368 domain-containing protein [Bacteroidales bacterium]